MKKLKLHGFNNLTKTLSFNIYDICYAKNVKHQREYIAYVDEKYNAGTLTDILKEVSTIIGATILNIAHQDYDPQGASVTMLIAEGPLFGKKLETPSTRPTKETVLAHLDKSHITVHTYPESHPDDGISTFRADIDISTCGLLSPLKALNFLLRRFESDIVTIDYRVRGFTRDITGGKHFIDHPIDSIQNFLPQDVQENYRMIDVNVYQENLFHTKMLLKDLELNDYLFGSGIEDFSEKEREYIKQQLQKEMLEIFYGRNVQHGPKFIN